MLALSMRCKYYLFMEPLFTEGPRKTPEEYKKFGFSLSAHLHFAEIEGVEDEITVFISLHAADSETNKRISTRKISPTDVLSQLVEIAHDETIQSIDLSEELPYPHVIPRALFRDFPTT